MTNPSRKFWGRLSGPSPYPTRAVRLARLAGAACVVAIFAPPLMLLVVGSLQQPGLAPSPTPDLIPEAASTESYQRAAAMGGLVRAGVNSLVVAAVAVPLSVVVASLAGFALTRLSRRAVGVIVGASLVALMVPATATLVPRFAMFRVLGLTNTLVPLIAPVLVGTSPLYVLVYYLAFRTIPTELYDVCRIANMSTAQVWWRVGMPLVRPVTAAVAAMTFVLTWSNFLDPLVFLYDRDLFTLPLALRSLATLDRTNYPIFLAAAVLATVPALVVFGLTQRRFLHVDDRRLSNENVRLDKGIGWFRR